MKIALGQTVLTSDRQKIGVVDRVLLNAVGKYVEHIVVHRGFMLDHDKVVARGSIDHVDDGGLHLSIDSDEAKHLPSFEHSYSANDMESGYPEVIPGPYQSMILFSIPPPGQTYLDYGHLFRLDPLEGTANSQNPGVPNAEIILGKGAGVVDSEGQRIGNVHRLEYDGDGVLASVVIQTGLVRHHELTIGAELIASIVDEEILLNVTSEVVTNHVAVPHSAPG